MANNEGLSRLERLPPELRTEIYRLAVIQNEPYDLTVKESRAQVVDPALALVNHNIRREVIPIFYGGNWFTINADLDIVDSNLESVLDSWCKRRSECTKFMRHLAAVATKRSPCRASLSVTIGDHMAFSIEFKGIQRTTSECVCYIDMVRGMLSLEVIGDNLASQLLLACQRSLGDSLENDDVAESCSICGGLMSAWRIDEEEVAKEEADKNAVPNSGSEEQSKRKKCSGNRKKLRPIRGMSAESMKRELKSLRERLDALE